MGDIRIGRTAVLTAILSIGCGLITATAADPKRADWDWLRAEGTAALMVRPTPLAGLKSWIIESRRHRGGIKSLAVAPDGKRAATGGEDGVVRIWNLETGALDKALVGHRYGIYLASWSPEGSLLATHAAADSTTRIWDVETGRERKQFTEWGWINRLAWSRDGRKLAASTGGSGKVYVSEGLAAPKLLTESGKPVQVMQWSPDGGRLAVAVAAEPVSLLDAATGRPVQALGETGEEAVTAVEWSAAGGGLAVATRRGVMLWQPDGSRLDTRLEGPAVAIAWSPDGKRLLVNAGARVLIHATEAAGKPQQLRKLADTTAHVAWNPRTDRIVVLAANRLEILQPDGTSVRSIDVGGSAAPAYRPGGPIVTGLESQVLEVWDSKSFASLGKLEGHQAPVTVAVWSPTGRLATGDESGGIRIWTLGVEPVSLTCQAHKTKITHLAWSADGEQLASLAWRDKEAKLWTTQAEPDGVLDGHEGPVLSLAWAPGGRTLATGGADERALVWETAPVNRKNEVAFTEPVLALAWSAARAAPAAAAILEDGTIQMFNPTTGKQLLVLEDVRSEGLLSEAVALWMPGGRPLLLTARNQLAQVWDLSGPRPVNRWIAPAGGTAAGFAGGGAVALVRNNDRTVRLHALKAGQWAGALLDEGGIPVAIDPTGEIRHPPDAQPELVAIIEGGNGQRTMSLEEFATRHGWKPGGKDIKLPVKE